MTYYLDDTTLDVIFAYVAERYGKEEEVPEYRTEETGMLKFLGVLDLVQSDSYYPSLLEKATYLLIAINKGHFFSNGNKRLALVATTIFLGINYLKLASLDKEKYKTLLENLFPEYKKYVDFEEFTSTDFATYNLSIIIADSGAYAIDHNSLKERVCAFFESSREDFEYHIDIQE